MLPKLYSDLLETNMETLKDFHVKWTHVKLENHVPTTDLDNYFMNEMCIQAAAGVYLQCHREYWSTTDKRATALHELSHEQRKKLPTNNLCCERYLAAQSAAHSNTFFKGKRIRDDLMTIQDDELSRIDCSMNSILKQLNAMELAWTDLQRTKQKE